MKKIKQFLLPPILIVLLLVGICTYGLITIFRNRLEETIPAYILYAFSTYTLFIVIFRLVYYRNTIKEKIMNHKLVVTVNHSSYVRRYSEDEEFKKNVNLYRSVIVNFTYALFKYVIGYFYSSVWEMAIAIYYTMLCVIKTNLIRESNKAKKMSHDIHQYQYELRGYLHTGYLMFLLNVTMSGMVIQMIWENQHYSYPGYIIYVSALFTFYSFISAFIQVIKQRKMKSPILSASKMVNYSGVFMSVFALQTAMITQFGSDPSFQRIMNLITGTAVMLIVFLTAIYMVNQGKKKLKNINEYYIKTKEVNNG